MDNNPGRTSNVGLESLELDIAAYIAGDDRAGGRICLSLESLIRAEVARFFPAADTDHDDIVQDSLLSLLTYLRRAGCSPRRPVAFVITIAGNRCRNLYRWRKRRPTVALDQAAEWLAGEGDDPLDLLEAGELESIIRAGLARLDAPCRQLLQAIYVEDRPIDELQKEAGLTTVQGIYYRKYSCLKKLGRLLNGGWFGGQESGDE